MLELANLVHVYPNGTRALDDVTLSIPKGMYGLLGPNGAGKSTLMRTIATLQTPTSGSIRFGDIDVIADPERLRETVQRVDRLKPLTDGGSLADLALRFILHHPAVSTTIAGMRRLPHVQANLRVSDEPPLAADRVAALRAHRWDRTRTR